MYKIIIIDMIGTVFNIVTYGLIHVSTFENLAAKIPKHIPNRLEKKMLTNSLKKEDAKLVIYIL
jgi:hypothetical protein